MQKRRKNDYLQIDVGLESHHKVRLLARLVNLQGREAYVVGHLVSFWGSVYRQRPEGFVDEIEDPEIEAWAHWYGEHGLFAEGLRLAGFIEKDCAVHEWLERYGSLLRVREAHAARVKNWRLGRVGGPLPENRCDSHVTATSMSQVPRTETERNGRVRERTDPLAPAVPRKPRLCEIPEASEIVSSVRSVFSRFFENPKQAHESAVRLIAKLQEDGKALEIAERLSRNSIGAENRERWINGAIKARGWDWVARDPELDRDREKRKQGRESSGPQVIGDLLKPDGGGK